METIDQIVEGELVQNDGELARKKLCIHGKPYYAYIGTLEEAARMGYTEEELDSAPKVSDWDTVTVEDCCG